MGTPDFAVACLKGLVEAKHDVCAVFTQPDKPRGRKMVMTPPDVKVYAQELDIPVYQPNTLKDGKALEIIESYAPDVIVVAAYGKILPKSIIDYPKYGCINVHGSILPIPWCCSYPVVSNQRRQGNRCHYNADERGTRYW